MTKQHCCAAAIVIDAGSRHYRACKAQRLDRLKPDIRIGPRHPRLAGLGFRFARWLAAKTMGLAGFHQLDSEFADARIALVRAKLARGETVYLAGLGAPGTHNSGLALVEVTQAELSGGGHTQLRRGEQVRIGDLLHMSLMCSDNVATRVLARESGLSPGDFLARMNTKSQELGLIDTRFVEFLDNGVIANAVNFPNVDMSRESPFRVAIANANVPNMVGQISTAMARAGLNIHNMVNKSRGEMAYTLVDVDSPIQPPVIDAISAIDGVLSVRAIPAESAG